MIKLKKEQMKTSWIFSIVFCFGWILATGQSGDKKDPVLFSVEGKPVHVSEFDYIYNKTNSGSADYSKASVEEYLDLYIKFKLKVQKAKDMQLDTISVLARELDGYRRQLADSYLVDKEVTDKLVNEVYDRKKKEREVSHILFKYKRGMDSTQVEQIAEGVLKMLLEGADFQQMAKAQSEDQNVVNNQGNLGYITAMMPNGFYEFENAVFNTEVGKIHPELVISPMGLHIIKVNSERPASGEVEVAHILIRDPENAHVEGAKAKIDLAYKELESGRFFDEIVREFSEDRLTVTKAGYLGFFGINRYEKAFEDAAFSLKENGAYSKPFRTSLGWHIVKRLNKKELEPLQVVKGRIQTQVTQDERFEIEKERMIDRIKENAGFKENKELVEKFAKDLDMEFLTYRWKPIEASKEQTLFTMGEDFKGTTHDFQDFLVRSQRSRLQMAKDSNAYKAAMILYDEFINESCIKFAESKLEVKYPEFKSLMREYEEGILLFEATKMKVWDKASQDTVGLKAYHNEHKNKYMWGERAQVVNYVLSDVNAKKAEKIKKYALKNGHEKTLKKYNRRYDVVNAEVLKVEKPNMEEQTGLPWQEAYSSELMEAGENAYAFSFVEALLPAQPKLLKEARGYIIADYQDYLEKQWVASLKKEYKVEINEEVLQEMTRS